MISKIVAERNGDNGLHLLKLNSIVVLMLQTYYYPFLELIYMGYKEIS
mgnify:CR=1 FL=1